MDPFQENRPSPPPRPAPEPLAPHPPPHRRDARGLHGPRSSRARLPNHPAAVHERLADRRLGRPDDRPAGRQLVRVRDLEPRRRTGCGSRDYRDMLAQVRRLGFNTIRLPFSLQALTSTDRQRRRTSRTARTQPCAARRRSSAMDVIIDEAARQGLLVILDCHSGPDDGYTEPLWYGNGYSEDDWVSTPGRGSPGAIATGPTSIGADLKNEPHGEAGLGQRAGGRPTGAAAADARPATRCSPIAPRWLILVEGIERPGRRRAALHALVGRQPPGRPHRSPCGCRVPSRLVYSPHEYGPGVSPTALVPATRTWRGVLADRWQKGFGFIVQRGHRPPPGRRVRRAPTSTPTSAEGRWQRQFLDYLGRTRYPWTYWAWNPNSGDTGGVLERRLDHGRRGEDGAAQPAHPPPAHRGRPRGSGGVRAEAGAEPRSGAGRRREAAGACAARAHGGVYHRPGGVALDGGGRAPTSSSRDPTMTSAARP